MDDRTLPPIYSLAVSAIGSQRGFVSESNSGQGRSAINPAIADLLTEYAIDRRVNLADKQEELRLTNLLAEVSEAMDADSVRAGLKAWKLQSKWMPELCELVEAAKPFVAERRERNREAREAKERAAARALPKPEYVDPATIGDALKFMHAKFAEADAKEGNASRKVDYTQGPLVPNMPAHADASDELRAFAARRMA